MDPEDASVLDALRRYLSDNPQACDSVDGISRWWLRGAFGKQQVERALQQLLADGFLIRHSATDGRIRWRKAR